jgi:hypothetical protein
MAAGKWKMYESAKLEWANGGIDFDSHSFKINLYLSTSNCNTLTAATIDQLSDLTNQVATNFGYTQNDKAITITTSNSGGTITIDGSDVSWTASGGDITAHFAVIYDDSHVSDMPCFVCYCNYNGGSPANVTATDGGTFNVTINVSGIMTFAGAASDT